MIKKILITYATAGIGHKKAAVAVKKALDEMAPQDVEVSLIDALDYTNAFFKWAYLKVYLLMVNKFPLVWGLLYYLTDNFYVNLIAAKIRNFGNRLNSKGLVSHLLGLRPDVVISTHFFASEVVSDLKERGILNTRLVTVVTDYRLHSWWVCDTTDDYAVGSDDAKEDLIRWKVDPSTVRVLGIPAEPIFSKSASKTAVLERIGFEKDVFTVLVIGGGFGVGPIEDIVKVVDRLPGPVQIIAICGHNEELVKRLEALKPALKARINILGFVDNVYEYMEISDILISKSGGITVAESLAKGLPMIVISPILGQETRNAGFLVKHGAALKVTGTSDLKELLEDLSSNPGRIKEMRDAIAKVRRPRACYDIAQLALDICRQKN